MKNLTFITGGARSGKSKLAEDLASHANKPVYYLASMQILVEDAEQNRRIAIHRNRRPQDWQTIDAAFDVHKLIPALPAQSACAIFDCLSLYTTNILIATTSSGSDVNDPYLKEVEIMAQVDLMLLAMSQRPDIEFIVVSNEVGLGVVPETALGRAFRDFLGLANQLCAAKAERAYLCCSGLKLQLK